MKQFLVITAIAIVLTWYFLGWEYPVGILLSIIIIFLTLLILKVLFMGIIFVPLRQNQFIIVEGSGDTGLSNASSGNFKRVIGYAIEIVDKKKKYVTFSSDNGAREESDSHPYNFVWDFLGAYPGLFPGVDVIKKYDFAWDKIVGGDKILEHRSEKVDSFFYSYVYGIPVKDTITLDRQGFDFYYRVPLRLVNIITAAYHSLPTGHWLKKYETAFFSGTQFYVGGKNSTDITREDFLKGGSKEKDLMDTLYKRYLVDMEESTGYKIYSPKESDDISVIHIEGHLTQEIKDAQEADVIAKAKKPATITNAQAKKEADLEEAIGKQALAGAPITGEMLAFKAALPDAIAKNPIEFNKAWIAYQQSKWPLTAYQVPTLKTI